MILATVGMQLPFPRLIRALDAIAARHHLHILAQALEPVAGLTHLDQRTSLTPAEFDALARDCVMIVGHAGIGTMLSAAAHAKPLVLFPRVAALGEHRNEHQRATARQFGTHPGITIAHDERELEQACLRDRTAPYRPAEQPQFRALIDRVADFVSGH
ncbi:glycosyltransferase [Sphingomonas sp. Mn802worker]|uniref:glycosyltransferase n=1 Tax=Sphingomonas sp. Mn802worker TaxID=629773 RepID=UPI000375A02F|nr:glycosyltransferase [Sphingomonas sp. Mn802worker]